MSLSCIRSSDPNDHVDLLYNSNTDEGRLYSGNGTYPHCNSTSPPPPSSCVMCFYQFIYAVCSDLLKNATLVMEGKGKTIDFKKIECPTFLGNASNENADMLENHAGTRERWMLLPIVFVFLCLVAYCILRAKRAVDFSQVNSEAEL